MNTKANHLLIAPQRGLKESKNVA